MVPPYIFIAMQQPMIGKLIVSLFLMGMGTLWAQDPTGQVDSLLGLEYYVLFERIRSSGKDTIARGST